MIDFHKANMTRRYSTSSSVADTATGGKQPEDDGNILHDSIGQNVHLHLLQSKDPIPYSSDIPLSPVNDGGALGHKKVTVVGCGQVGMGIAFAMLNQTVAGTIALVDRNKSKLDGEARDLEQGSAFHQHVRVLASDNYSVSQDSHLVIITAGAAQTPGESRLNLVSRNVEIMKSIIPNVLAFSPNAAICIVSNPCDLMTAVAAKIAGPSVPPGRIFGSGTCLDSSRLKSMLAKRLGIDGQGVSGYVIGEHGDSSVPVWSSVRVGGVPILKPGDEPSSVHDAMHKEVVDSAYDIIQRKGYTNWSVGLTGAFIGRAVLDDTHTIMPVSTCVRGLHGIEEDVFLSVPCVMGSHGVRQLIDLPLTDLEEEQFRKSAATLWDIQKDVWEKV
eukprot:CAMPEP_0119551590 /NCGR_PEP_ID=MMETSP1352-20130426/4801_1 /TAXON_ID=265584 /ORGANISM="Stauroneis constricta, Strain CCMP1120" /LENGTH=385 /DNA_ID=CAMNT_0007597673 /DNA_START=266 /DNA_END=1423 /DNA_ORIENTATION=+